MEVEYHCDGCGFEWTETYDEKPKYHEELCPECGSDEVIDI